MDCIGPTQQDLCSKNNLLRRYWRFDILCDDGINLEDSFLEIAQKLIQRP